MKTLATLAALAILVPAAAGAQPPASPTPARGAACFWKQDISNFNAPNDTTLYMRVGVSQVWELKLFGNCFDLSWLNHIRLRTFGSGSVCEGSTPNLQIYTRSLATGPQQCPVTSVRRLTPEEVAGIPKKYLP